MLPPERLAGDTTDERPLEDIPHDILRNARCMGYLDDVDFTGVNYVDALRKARDDLLSLTRQLHGVTDDDERQLRSRILRNAHGLMGTTMHLLDLFSVSVTRELRLPFYSRDFHSDGHDNRRRNDLLRFLMTALPISSRYGHYSTQRVLFESRDEKRTSILGAPTSSSEHPIGELIGQWTIVGRGVNRLVPYLEDVLRNPNELQIDGENFTEFRVDFRIESDWMREKATEAVHRMSTRRGRTANRQIVCVLSSFLRSVYDVCRALSALPRLDEPSSTALSTDDCRYAMSTLPPNRILPGATPTQSKIIHALFGSDGPLIQKELAERADVSSQSIRNNREALLLFDIIERADQRYQLTFDIEGGSPVTPWFVKDGITLHDVLRDATRSLLEDEKRLSDLTDSFGSAFYWPTAIEPITDEWSWMPPFIRYVGAYVCEDFFARSLDNGQMGVPTATMTGFGDFPSQTSLSSFNGT
ncbi:hypothetical protein [Haloferax prahovense]|uniref:hypothetical protein n=1 Tax=Haloferax prahovense TaxID=381852 RepID=UPI001267926F|nr:hypothetical protein [Haloferax prahovense]